MGNSNDHFHSADSRFGVNEDGTNINSNNTLTTEEFTFMLPRELCEKILQYLSPSDLCQFSLVCVHFRDLANSDRLWLHHCIVRGWLRFGVNTSILHEAPLYTNHTNVSGTSPLFHLHVLEESHLAPVCRWREVFMRCCKLSRNWRLGHYTTSPILRGHREKVTAFDCDGYTLVSGSPDKQLKVWDIRSSQCTRTLRGHTDTVSAVRLKGQQVVTGCGDGAVRVYDVLTGKLTLSFQGHSGSVDHLHFLGSCIVSAATDRTLRIWCMNEKRLLYTLRGHDDDIECVSVHNGRILSGSWDRTLILWRADTGKPVLHLVGHTEAITSVQFDDVKAVSGSADGDVRVWCLTSGCCVQVMSSGQEDKEVYCVVYNNDVIASGYSDSLVQIWNHDGELRHTLKEHLGVVRCLHICDQRLVSGGDQKKLVVWDYREGKKLCVIHRNPTKLQRMQVTDTRIVTSSPETPGTLMVISFW